MRHVMCRVVLAALVCVTLAPLASPKLTYAAQSYRYLSPVRHIQVNGASFGYRMGGAGFPLVLVMGRGGTLADWDPRLITTLMQHHHVIIFDNRGVATTTNPSTATFTVAQMADDTVGLMNAFGIRRADLMGWSMGGYIAQTVTITHPSMVRKLVLSATDPGGPHAIYPPPRIAKILDNPHLTSATLFALCFPPDSAGLSGAVGYFRRVLTQPGLVKNSFTFTAKAKANQEAATAQFKAASGGTVAQLPSIQQPTLVADGREDLVVPIANARLLASTIPHAQLIVYPNAGHAFLFQDSAQYGKAINRFLS